MIVIAYQLINLRKILCVTQYEIVGSRGTGGINTRIAILELRYRTPLKGTVVTSSIKIQYN